MTMGFDMSVDMGVEMGVEVGSDWEREAEMQQLLDMVQYVQQDLLPSIQTGTEDVVDDSSNMSGNNSALGLELCGGIGTEWETVKSSGVGVF